MTDAESDKEVKPKPSSNRKAKSKSLNPSTLIRKIKKLPPEWAAAIGTWLTILPITVSIFLVWIQISRLQTSVENQTYQSVYETEFGIHKYFLDNPQYRPYFYQNISYLQTNDAEKDRIEKIKLDTLAEWVCDFFDDVYQQRDTMTRDTFSKWRKFMKDIYQTSPVLREFIAKHGADWYPEDFIADIKTPDTSKPMPAKKH